MKNFRRLGKKMQRTFQLASANLLFPFLTKNSNNDDDDEDKKSSPSLTQKAHNKSQLQNYLFYPKKIVKREKRALNKKMPILNITVPSWFFLII